jgi:hypothetical protein
MREDVIAWLLEEENPSVRYLTLTSLLDLPADDPLVMHAKEVIMRKGIVPQILAKQNEDGSWGIPQDFYLDQYRGTVWTLLLLAELAVDTKHPQIKKACEFILQNSQHPDTGGFSYLAVDPSRQDSLRNIVPCLTGNMTYALIKLGFLEDIRVQNAIDWITRTQRADDGDQARPKGGTYDLHKNCWGKHSCHMGVAKSLKALAEIPDDRLNDETRAKRNQLVDYFLIHHIYKKSHDLASIARPEWKRFGFPLMYQCDILEIMRIMATLNIDDPRLQDAIEIIRNRQNEDGKWMLERTYNGRTIVRIEKKGLPSKWITLKALTVLKAQDCKTGQPGSPSFPAS